MKYKLSIYNRDCDANILEMADDEMDIIVECPYCGKPTKVGDIFSMSGFAGCKNCYWAEGGLRETIMDLRENDYESYRSGEFYKRGYNDWKVKK